MNPIVEELSKKLASDSLLEQIRQDQEIKDPEVKVHHDDPHSYGTGFNDEGEDDNPREERDGK